VNVDNLPSIPPGRLTRQNNESWREVLKELKETIVQSADRDDVFLDRILDHLISTRCITEDQCEVVKRERYARSRINKLLQFISSEGHNAFNELCNALENLGTDDKKLLASRLRQAQQEKNTISGRHNTLFMLEYSGLKVK